jgi:TRAP-type C4-dicarboxylate transport system permease small subunit
MTKSNEAASEKVWQAIKHEKRHDQFLRRVGIGAWSVTLAFVLLLGILVGTQVAEMWKGYAAGALPWISVVGVAMPFLIILALLSVLIATLATIGIFVRSRAATLNEIQLRLAALEEMIVSGSRAEGR